MKKLCLWKYNGTASVIYDEGEQSDCRHNTWFLISDTRIFRQQKLQSNSRDISVSFILFYEKRSSNLFTAQPN